jgi:hypothetical protein
VAQPEPARRPGQRSKREEIGWESVDFYGQSAHRSYDQPGQPGLGCLGEPGPSTGSSEEHLGQTDHGVRLLRNALRRHPQSAAGTEPLRPGRPPADSFRRLPAAPSSACEAADDDRVYWSVAEIAEFGGVQDLPDAEGARQCA